MSFNDYQNPVKAAGVLVYKIVDGQVHLLLRQAKNKGFADFGGKREPQDKSPLDTAIREAVEESNKIFSKEQLQQNINQNNTVYIRSCKYLLHFIKVDDVDAVKFGSREEFMNEQHEVRWFAANEQINLHIRLSELYQDILKMYYAEEPEAVLQPESWDQLGISGVMRGLLKSIDGFKSKRSPEIIEQKRSQFECESADIKSLLVQEHFSRMNEVCSQLGYCCTRLRPFSPAPKVLHLQDYVMLNDQVISDQFKAENGKTVFYKVVDLLRVLYFQRRFIKNFKEAFVVRLSDCDVQLFDPVYETQFQIHELQEFATFLKVNDQIPHFFAQKQQLAVESSIELVKVVENANQIKFDNVGEIFVQNGVVMTNNQILKFLQVKQLDQQLWILLIRFMMQKEAITDLRQIPSELEDFIKYENAKPLPSFVSDQFPQENPHELLRLVLGMHPTQEAVCVFPQTFQAVISKMSIWYRARLAQILFLNQLEEADCLNVGRLIQCPTNEESLIELVHILM